MVVSSNTLFHFTKKICYITGDPKEQRVLAEVLC